MRVQFPRVEGKSYLANVEEGGGVELAEAARLDGPLKGPRWNSRPKWLILQGPPYASELWRVCELTPLVAGPGIWM